MPAHSQPATHHLGQSPVVISNVVNVSISNPGNEPSAGSTDTRPSNSIWEIIDNPWVVLALLFFVMAILGLPVLWKSRGFSTLSKVVLSVVVTLYTALIFWFFWLVLVWCYTRIVDSLT